MAIVHDVLHCAQHCNQHVGDVWMMTMFAICGRALVVLAAAAVVAYKSLLAKSATTETTSLVLMPCSTEHSGADRSMVQIRVSPESSIFARATKNQGSAGI